MQDKHIVHITTIHPHRDTRIFHKECVSLAKNGYRVTQLCTKGESGVFDGVNIIAMQVTYGGLAERVRKLPRILYHKAVELDADLYHFHDPEFLPYALKLIKSGKKVVYDSHEDVPRQILTKPFLNKALRKGASLMFEPFEDHIVRRLTGIVTADDVVLERFLKVNPNTIVLKNYPRLDQFPDPVPFAEKKNEVFYVGDIAPIRGAIEMVKAMEYVDNATLVLAGPIETVELEEQMKNLPGWDKVRYEGFVSPEKRAELLARAKAGLVVLHPIKKYQGALPVKLFEYMASGIPVVSTNLKLWKDIIDEARCGYTVNALDPKDIAGAINKILENDLKSQEMGMNGYRKVKEKYSWETEEEKLLEFYERILINN